ncbi:MAG: glycosyltransferase family 39 protein [Rhodospirillales bacterium]|nr:glycosyltransferase family 39 protein [Rhodospirillales bacterium]
MRRWPWPLFALLAALTLWRLAVLADHAPNLSFDEAQYWLWSRHPAFGYFSKPPMVAWLIAAATALCGEGEACVKAASPLIWAVAALFVHAAGAALYGRRTGLWAAALFATLPGVSFSSLLISTDPPLLMFWAAALAAFVRAVESNRMVWWAAAGLAIGLGLLSKYAAAFFLLSAALALMVSPERRPLLRSRGFAVMLGCAALAFLPNLAWNLTHNLVSFAHTRDNANLGHGGGLFHPDKLAEFLGAQFGVFGPILFAALLLMLALIPLSGHRIAADPRRSLLLAFTLPPLLIIAAQALLSRANANWAAAAYVSGTILVAGWLAGRRAERWLAASLALHLLAAGVIYHFDALTRLTGFERIDPMKRVRGWDRAGADLSRVMAAHPGLPLMGLDRQTLAPLVYYTRPHAFEAVKWNPAGLTRDHFELTTSLTERQGGAVLYVDETPPPAEMLARFEQAEPLSDIAIPLRNGTGKSLKVVLLSGFKGYR